MATTTEEQRAYSEYAERLPDIYREILAAFPRIEPHRKAGYGLAFQTIAADFESRGTEYTLGAVIQACEQLRDNGLVEIQYGIFVRPTDRGELVITAITGKEPRPAEIPPLPPPPRLG
jgi:hypothetical protein